jgi:hypothetical protein
VLQGSDGKVVVTSRVTATFLQGDSAGEVTLPISTTVDRMPEGRLSLACNEVALGGGSRALGGASAQPARHGERQHVRQRVVAPLTRFASDQRG